MTILSDQDIVQPMKTDSTYYRNHRAEIIPALPAQYTRVLEIGCGEGRFRANLSLPHEYWGIEPSQAAAKVAEKQLDQTLIGTYTERRAAVPDDYFDLIICNDVIEHMTDHDFFFQDIKSKLHTGGVIVASLPNVRHVLNLFELLVKKDWQYKDEGILDRTHFRFFTQKSLLATLERHQYQVEFMQGINGYEGDAWWKSLIGSLAIAVLGQDTRYLQFAIRIREKGG